VKDLYFSSITPLLFFSLFFFFFNVLFTLCSGAAMLALFSAPFYFVRTSMEFRDRFNSRKIILSLSAAYSIPVASFLFFLFPPLFFSSSIRRQADPSIFLASYRLKEGGARNLLYELRYSPFFFLSSLCHLMRSSFRASD